MYMFGEGLTGHTLNRLVWMSVVILSWLTTCSPWKHVGGTPRPPRGRTVSEPVHLCRHQNFVLWRAWRPVKSSVLPLLVCLSLIVGRPLFPLCMSDNGGSQSCPEVLCRLRDSGQVLFKVCGHLPASVSPS